MTDRDGGADNRRYLLSIDGGGIRGIIPATLFVALERTTGRPARDIFSFVAGTSTGAVIASAVAAGIPAQRILDLYARRAGEIFTPSLLNLPRRILTGSMYSIGGLHRILREELASTDVSRLNDAPVDILVTAKRLSDGMPWYFVRDTPMNSGQTGSLSLADCATASAAAPTYFKPWRIGAIGELVDGSVGVTGNPVYQACVEAFDYSLGYDPSRTTVVSLGTGRFTARRRPGWLWGWLTWIVSELLRSPGEQQTDIVRRMYPSLHFYRIDPKLPHAVGLDATDQIERLQQIGAALTARVDWPAILAGDDHTFRIGGQNTLWTQYAYRV
ncbi:MAG: patatin-like phospholipase family protein [Dehalococcoidia bacterium]